MSYPSYKKYKALWGEISYDMLSDEAFETLLDAEFGVLTGEALIDQLKSDVDASNFDIPKIPGSIF